MSRSRCSAPRCSSCIETVRRGQRVEQRRRYTEGRQVYRDDVTIAERPARAVDNQLEASRMTAATLCGTGACDLCRDAERELGAEAGLSDRGLSGG